MIALGTSEHQRSSVTPNIPELTEHQLLKELDISSWLMLLGPNGMSPAVTAHLQKALQDGSQDPIMRKRFEDSGSKVFTGKEDSSAYLLSETAK